MYDRWKVKKEDFWNSLHAAKIKILSINSFNCLYRCEQKVKREACKIINTMDYLLIAVNVIQLKSEEGI